MVKIGIEVHVQLMGCKSKLFCGCPTSASDEPNTQTCEICAGMPGSKPVLNKKALEQSLKVAKALNCIINKTNFFSRKSYFYPDLAKNYQITQYELPLAIHGDFQGIKIRRIHLEEDPGALIHKDSYCLIDYNRSGIPLIEIVTEPDFTSAKEVREFIKKLITVLEYLEVYDRKSEATLKADLNISTTGEKVEIKNVNGLQDIELALEYETKRQEKEPSKKQETRGWDTERRATFLQRIKEREEDYGYINEGDLPIIGISEKELLAIKIPELAIEKTSRFQEEHKIERGDAEILAKNKKLADLFEIVSKKVSPELAAKWIIRDIVKQCNIAKKRIEDLNLKAEHLIELLSLFEKKQITDNTTKAILRKLIEEKPFSPEEYVKKHNLLMKSDNKQLEQWCLQAIKQSPEAVQEYKKGNEKSLNFIMGKVMQLSNKTANPQEVVNLLKKLLN